MKSPKAPKMREKTLENVHAKVCRMVPMNVRVPEHVWAQLVSEADASCEDLSATIRRRLYAGLHRDDINARLEAMGRKLEALIERAPSSTETVSQEHVENLTEAVLEVERRVSTQALALERIEQCLDKIAEAYGQIVNFINASRSG